MQNKVIIMIGCGNMGAAMLRRLLQFSDNIFYVVKPTILPDDLRDNKRVNWVNNVAQLPHNLQPVMVILAVKPQIMHQVLLDIKVFMDNGGFADSGIVANDDIGFDATANSLSPNQSSPKIQFCTMAAGLNIGFYHRILGDVSILRIMPNTPVAIGEGVVNLYGDSKNYGDYEYSGYKKNIANQLLAPLGQLIWLEEERMIDVATAISGSGSAYVYLFMEALANAATELGIEAELARQMAQQTVLGAAKLATIQPAKSLQQLQAEVTSKGGTTAAAMQQLQKNDALKQLIFQAVQAALARAVELNHDNTMT